MEKTMMNSPAVVLVIRQEEIHDPVPSVPRILPPPPRAQGISMPFPAVIYFIVVTAVLFFLLGLSSGRTPVGETGPTVGSPGPYVEGGSGPNLPSLAGPTR